MNVKGEGERKELFNLFISFFLNGGFGLKVLLDSFVCFILGFMTTGIAAERSGSSSDSSSDC